jgi:hypothetical protein
MVSLKLEIFYIYCCKDKIEINQINEKSTAHAYWRGRPSRKYKTNLRSRTGRKSRFKADFSDCLGGPQKTS